MEERLFYIEPSALCLSLDDSIHVSEEKASDFLDQFEKMIYTLSYGNHKFLIDSYLKSSLVDDSWKNLIPLKVSEIKKQGLKERVLKIQQVFIGVINPLVEIVNINVCSLENQICFWPKENFEISEKEKFYCEFFHSVLSECYRNEDSDIESCIIKIPGFSKLLFHENLLSIHCHCLPDKKFIKNLSGLDYTQLIDKKDLNKKMLKNLIKENKRVNLEDVKVVQSEHESIIGNTILKNWNDIPSKFNKVLRMLNYFGLKKIEFRNWKSHDGKKGSIYNCVLKEGTTDQTTDIIEGWIILQDKSCRVVMYFPKNVGELLLEIVCNDFEYGDMVNLKNELIG